MKIFILAASFLLCITGLWAQNPDASLIAQSPDGRTVKLIWSINNAGNGPAGVDIKRKDGIGEWEKLNKEAILPGIYEKKDFSQVESDVSEAGRMRAHMFRLIEEHRISSLTHERFVEKWKNNEKEIQDLFALMGHDYDVALISGFAFVDHTVTSKTAYQYGLFAAGTNNLLATTNWDYGEIPDLNVVRQITAKGTAKTKGIRVIWNADPDKMKAAEVAGFNIYRQGIRLNQLSITSQNDDDLSEFSWYDKSANGNVMSQYSISAESVFDIEGIIKSYIYNPAEHPDEYRSAEVKEISSLGYYFKDGMNIRWSFPSEYEKFIKGFYVEKNDLPAGYKRVSQLLDPGARAFIDKSSSPVSTYIGVRVIALYTDKTVAAGPGGLFNYFPIRQPPAPQGLKIKGIKEDKKTTVKLTWDAAMTGDTITAYYRVYAEDPATGRFSPVAEKQPVKKSSYTYTIQHNVASVYRFYVEALTKWNEETAASDTVSLPVSSAELPVPAIKDTRMDGTKAVIQWEYSNVEDLKGFRLYQDNNLIATEKELPKDKKTFTTPELTEENSYEFTVMAVSENGVCSEASAPATVVVPLQKKRKKK